MSYPASDVFDMSASLLNDTAKTVFTDADQMPYLNMAYRELGSLLTLNNVPVTNATSAVVPVDADGDNIGGDDMADPALPTGLVEIQQLWQRQTGTSNPFVPITKYEFLPHYWDDQEVSFIPAWAWLEQIVKFIPSNTATDVKFDYIKSAVVPVTDADDEILIIDSLNFLGYRTAGLCARFIGENPIRADSLDIQAKLEFDVLLGTTTKGRQSMNTRRRPFRAAFKNRRVV